MDIAMENPGARAGATGAEFETARCCFQDYRSDNSEAKPFVHIGDAVLQVVHLANERAAANSLNDSAEAQS